MPISGTNILLLQLICNKSAADYMYFETVLTQSLKIFKNIKIRIDNIVAGREIAIASYQMLSAVKIGLLSSV